MVLKNSKKAHMRVEREPGLYESLGSKAALVSLIMLVAVTLLFPDTFTNVGFRVGPLRLSPLSITLAIATPAVALFAWKQRHKLTLRPLDLFLLASFIFVTVRGGIAADTANGLGLVIAYMAYALLLYFGMAVLAQERRTLKIVYISLAVLATIIAGYAMLEFFLNENILFGELVREKAQVKNPYLLRAAATLAHPVFLGAVMVQLVPLPLFFFLKAETALKKLIWGGAIVLCAMGLFVSFAKGSWVTAALLIAGGVIWIMWRKPAVNKTSLALLALVIGIAILSLSIFYNANVAFNVSSETRMQESIDTRWVIWSKFPETFKASPFVGTGIWKHSEAIPREDLPEEEIPTLLKSPPVIDNLFLAMLVEQGIVGSLLAGMTLILIAGMSWRIVRNQSMWTAELSVPISIGIAAILINGMTFNSLLVWPSMVIFWLETGILRGMTEVVKTEPANDAGQMVRCVV